MNGAMGSGASSIMMLVLMIAVFYFLLIRPESKRKKQAAEMRNSLGKGEKITTIGGIVGTIIQVNEDTFVIETSEDRVRMEITKWAISTKGVQATTDPRAAAKKKKQQAQKEADRVPEEPTVPQEIPEEAPVEEKTED